MAKQTVQDLILQKLDNLEKKVDLITTQTLPDLMKDVAVNGQEMKDEARMASKIYSMVWGGITLLVSITGVAVAYLKSSS